ncbi:MAG TPA: M13 family metallopeptidase [Rhodanobacteraceae bacterium]|nr:M13 family metallopeptidase [Rhodanobacteraceae bacterium]
MNAAALPDVQGSTHAAPEPIEPVRFDVRDLDPDGDPRLDLDAYVNARWRARNPVPPDRSCWDTFAVLGERTLAIEAAIAGDAAARETRIGTPERIVGDFWTSGMHGVADAAPLRAELAGIERLDSAEGIAAYVRDTHARGVGVLFRLDVEPDFEAPEQTIAYVSQAELGLPDRDDYFDTTSHALARRRAYLAHIATMFELAGWGDAALAEDVLAFETVLAGASTPRRELASDIAMRFRPVDIDAADRATPHFPWSSFFPALGIAPPRRFSLATPAFFAAFDAELGALHSSLRTPARWRAYLAFHAIDAAAPFLGRAFEEQHHDFHRRTLRGQKSMAPRWRRIVEAIDMHAGEAMGRLYIARCFSGDAKRRVEDIAENLRAAMRTRLETIDWMSEATCRAALRKLTALRFRIGHPERWRDLSGLETNPHSLHANVLAARRFEQRERIARIGRRTDRTRWSLSPQTVNARYDPQRNEVVFPAAMLAPPFFDVDTDDALNYGGIGAVIAHELTHAFDDQGSRFDADGRLANWWTSEDRARFDALADRVRTHFDAIPAGSGEQVDGRLTLGENIADFGGLAIAYDALMRAVARTPDPMIDGYTQAQRFFFGWATIWRQNLTLGEASFRLRHDRHAPAGVRANAGAANLEGYTQAFECGQRDPMCVESGRRISIW